MKEGDEVACIASQVWDMRIGPKKNDTIIIQSIYVDKRGKKWLCFSEYRPNNYGYDPIYFRKIDRLNTAAIAAEFEEVIEVPGRIKELETV